MFIYFAFLYIYIYIISRIFAYRQKRTSSSGKNSQKINSRLDIS